MVLHGPLEPASPAFPTVAQLRQGVLLGTIVHAIATLPADYFHDEYTWHGHALRSEGETLTAGEPWPEVYHHGAHILRLELSDPELALAEWENGMQLRPEQVVLARQLYQRRLATTDPPMHLTAAEYARLTAHGAAQLEPVRTLLAAVGIALP